MYACNRQEAGRKETVSAKPSAEAEGMKPENKSEAEKSASVAKTDDDNSVPAAPKAPVRLVFIFSIMVDICWI